MAQSDETLAFDHEIMSSKSCASCALAEGIFRQFYQLGCRAFSRNELCRQQWQFRPGLSINFFTHNREKGPVDKKIVVFTVF